MSGRSLHEIFRDRAVEAPGRIAVTASGEQLTYGELDARAEALADRLAARGVRPGVLVGLGAHRGIELVVGLLGILKAGGAYVPLDPDYPAARLLHLLEDTGVRTVVATAEAAKTLPTAPDVEIVPISAEAGADTTGAAAGDRRAATGSDLAYVIHTSGSTGLPKGVLVEHRQVVRLFSTTRDWFGFGPEDVWTLFHSASFDFSVWEIWGALLHGGRLVVVDKDLTRVPADLHALLRAERVTVLNQTPSAFRQLDTADADHQGPGELALRLVVFGGERLDVRDLAGWLERHGDARPRLVNMYGITETCVHASYRPITTADLDTPEHSPIGVPLPDLEFVLAGPDGAAVPDGTPGELLISGAGVTRGYLDRPELTAERFTTGSFGGGPVTRHYHSGDLAVRTPDGELRYLGRLDDQLKVRGFRIEPREIEHCLLGHPQVRSAVVVAHDYDGDPRLAAFVVPESDADPAALPAALAAHAAAALPAHLRPSAHRVIDAIPLTPQGKTDREALHRILDEAPATVPPSPSVSPAPSASVHPSPSERGAVAAVTEIVHEILRGPQPPPAGVDLFDIGATSLAFVRIVAQVNQRFGLRLTGAELGGEATVARLALCVEERTGRYGGQDSGSHDHPVKEQA
ncbi:amino acid adenylation domain-containing protein [Streptomyces sp. NPDC088261]|uniref:amino acid adenylation domain-containing protein n=1 Tax=Streptomyces sp. NPDC088261 TaxID=3365851 RepID=UPI0038069E46